MAEPPPSTELKRPLWRRILFAPLLIATAVAVLFGVVQPVPFDSVLRQVQSELQPLKASGRIVIVDTPHGGERSGAQDRLADARLLTALHRYAPAEVFVEKPYFDLVDPVADGALAEAIDSWGDRIVLAAKTRSTSVEDDRAVQRPPPLFTRSARIGNTAYIAGPFGMTDTAPFARAVSGRAEPSFAALMAHRFGPVDTNFLLDLRINPSTIPHQNAIVLIKGKVPPSAIAGKVLIITGVSAPGEGPRLPVYGIVSQTDVHVLAAETLLRGMPVNLDFAPLLFAFLLAEGVILRAGVRPRMADRGRIVLAIVLVGAAAVARLWLINLDVTPALVALMTVSGIVGWHRRKARAEQTNARSGLPNMTGFRRTRVPDGCAVIVARITRFDETIMAVPPDRHGDFARAVAHRLAAGDEHVLIHHDESGHFAWTHPAHTLADVEAHLSGLKALFGTPVELSGRKIDVEIAFGVDLNDGRPVALRLTSATDAAAEAASRGEVSHSVDAGRIEQAQWRASLHSAIDAALANEEIWIAYQPKLTLASGEVTGAEALVRWAHPTRGNIPPDDFIDHAERDGRIDSLTWAVLDHAVASAGLLGSDSRPFGVAVNLSAVMLSRPQLHPRVMEHLARHRLPPDRLTLELTETVPLGEDPVVMDNLLRLRAAGVRISIDDYGTGSSNLLYLRHVPSDEIKIDRAFVTGLPLSPENTAIVRGTIDMVHALGRCVVAEGVEDLDTLRLLGRMGCDVAQGYAIARPMNITDLRRSLQCEADVRLSAMGGR